MRRNADDGVVLVAELDLGADDGAVAPERARPQRVADDHDVLRRVRRVLGGTEEPAELGANAEQGKEIVGRGAKGNEHRVGAGAERGRVDRVRRHVRERVRGMLEGVVRHPSEGGARHVAVGAGEPRSIEAHHARRVGDVTRPADQQAVHGAEHRGVGADPERQRDDDEGGHDLVSSEAADGKAHVVAEVVEQIAKSHTFLPPFGGSFEVMKGLLDASAQSVDGFDAGLGGAHAEGDELFGARLENGFELRPRVGSSEAAQMQREAEEAAHALTNRCGDHRVGG